MVWDNMDWDVHLYGMIRRCLVMCVMLGGVQRGGQKEWRKRKKWGG